MNRKHRRLRTQTGAGASRLKLAYERYLDWIRPLIGIEMAHEHLGIDHGLFPLAIPDGEIKSNEWIEVPVQQQDTSELQRAFIKVSKRHDVVVLKLFG